MTGIFLEQIVSSYNLNFDIGHILVFKCWSVFVYAGKEVNVKNTFAVVRDDLNPDKYSHLGLTLGLTLATIKRIEANYSMRDRRLMEIIQAWIDRSTSVNPSVKWKTLAQALVDIEEKRLAEKIVFLGKVLQLTNYIL